MADTALHPGSHPPRRTGYPGARLLEPDGFWPGSLEFFVRRGERKIRPEKLRFAGARRAIKELQTQKPATRRAFCFADAAIAPPTTRTLHEGREECGTHEFKPRPEDSHSVGTSIGVGRMRDPPGTGTQEGRKAESPALKTPSMGHPGTPIVGYSTLCHWAMAPLMSREPVHGPRGSHWYHRTDKGQCSA